MDWRWVIRKSPHGKVTMFCPQKLVQWVQKGPPKKHPNPLEPVKVTSFEKQGLCRHNRGSRDEMILKQGVP